MEIKDTLNKPYNEEERMLFIVKHQHGFEIRETDTALEAWGKTDEEKSAAAKQAQIAELVTKLDALDLKAIRPMRAKEAGTATQEDLDKLAEIENQAQEYRAQLESLK